MKELILSLFIWLGLFTPPKPFVISEFDPGGDVATYVLMWDRLAATELPIVLDGACVSACTLVLASVPPDRICVTPRASLGIHQAATVDDSGATHADPEVTRILQTTFYPPWLQQWIRNWVEANGQLTLDVVYVEYDELSKHYRTCSEIESPIAGV